MAGIENPLGIGVSAWRDLTDMDRAHAERVAAWDFDFLIGDQLKRHGVADTAIHKSVLLELKRFLFIKICREPHPLGCFGPMVAAAWHAFILDTQRYEEFCQSLYGRTIHHKPSNYGEGVLDNSLWISIYTEWFGKFPKVWKLGLDGQEIPGYEYGMNVQGNVVSSDLDSDDGAYP